MKKLMFATALVASAAAFADGPTALNATSFEGYNSVDGSFLSDKGDVGEGGGAKYFYYDGDSDASLVKAFGGDNLAVPGITRPLYALLSQFQCFPVLFYHKKLHKKGAVASPFSDVINGR